MVAGGAALEGGGERVAVDQLPPVAAGAGEEHGRLLAGRLTEVVVDLVNHLRRHLVLEDDRPRRDAQLAHLAEVEDALLGQVARIDADADLVGFGVSLHHPQGVLQADRLRVYQVAQERGPAHLGDKAVHHRVLGVAERAVERLARRHHLVADGADRLEEVRPQEFRGVVRREAPAAADVAGQEQDEVGQLVRRGAQAELGVARCGQLHQPRLRRLDDGREVAAHGRLQVRDGAAHALEEQARHARQERLPAGKAPDVDGQVDV
jgi:hypothetical protein